MKLDMDHIGKSSVDEYKVDSNEAVRLKLVSSVSEIEDDGIAFKPVMSHQIFGSSETIFGYSGLTVELYYSACRLTTYVNVKYDKVIEPDKNDGLQPDDIIRSISKHIPAGFLTNRDEFGASLDKEKAFKPFGNLVHSYTRTKAGKARTFEIYKTSIEEPGFRGYHERLQTFLLWFVDAASFIDVDDDRWSYYLIFEKTQTLDGDTMYKILGYQTVYAYYAYPDLLRPRISQVLILPPYQRQGHGVQLLQTFYRECWEGNKVLDITVEDPSEDYQRVRDYLDVKNCLEKGVWQDKLQGVYCKELFKQVQSTIKLNKKQARRVFEILKLQLVTDAESMKEFRLMVKKRLFQPFQKSRKEYVRMEQALQPDEFEATKSLTKAQKHQYFEDTFQEILVEYRRVLERLAMTQ